MREITPGNNFCSNILDEQTIQELKENPRAKFIEAIRKKDAATCLLKTAEIHGHFCPGSALGVMASLYGLGLLREDVLHSDGIMENLLAIVEVNACFADGIQAVSGCTLGNNSLIYRDLGKHAVTFAIRGKEKGIRVRVKPEFRSCVEESVPEFYPLLEKVIVNRAGTTREETAFREKARDAAFAMIGLPFGDILDAETVIPDIPGYAPITASVVCPECKEVVMATKVAEIGPHKGKCFMCSRQFFEVEGKGIVLRDLSLKKRKGRT